MNNKFIIVLICTLLYCASCQKECSKNHTAILRIYNATQFGLLVSVNGIYTNGSTRVLPGNTQVVWYERQSGTLSYTAESSGGDANGTITLADCDDKTVNIYQ
ncbi:MAG: hypothetical protein U0X41_10115 [Chitinophagales bacterium]